MTRAGWIALGALIAAQTAGAATGQTAEREVAAATRLARQDLRQPLFLCEPNGGGVVGRTLATQSDQWVEPTRAFDNLFFIGNGFVGVWILKTSEGLILFDSTQSEAEAHDHLVPGLKTLGLDPADIRYVIVTHGHFDHFGGAAWLQQTYGARVALGKADWDLIERTPSDAREQQGRTKPRRDIEVTDGQRIELGDTIVTLHVTPGHTPATVSAIVPARERGKTHILSLLGSTAFPPNVEPNDKSEGQRAYDASVLRFAEISRKAGAEGILNTHGFADGTLDRLAAARARKAGQPNPFLTGGAFVGRYYDILHHCLLASQARAAAQ